MEINSNKVIYGISNVYEFNQLLASNPGVLVIKFGATWCGPCKRIEPYLQKYYPQMPSNVQCVVVDIDQNMEIYSFMKNRKMVAGVPALLAYKKDNLTYIPDFTVVGGDPGQVHLFFQKVVQQSNQW